MKKYNHIFFDLDHTLWDFEKNSEETICEIFEELNLGTTLESAPKLYKAFERANRWVWDQYHRDLIPKDAFRTLRFEMALAENGIRNPELANKLSELYLKICPCKPHLLPDTIEVLTELSQKYPLHLISNGFEETTMTKVETTLLKGFFRTITTPTRSGFKKPHASMFSFALKAANCRCSESIMIGDDLEADVLGAKRSGIDCVFFNPGEIFHNEEVTFEIKQIRELLLIL